jgi:hypothetical protein
MRLSEEFCASRTFVVRYLLCREGEGFQNFGSCGAVVFVDQCAETVAAPDLNAARWRGRACRFGREQREAAVRPLAVVVGGVGAGRIRSLRTLRLRSGLRRRRS